MAFLGLTLKVDGEYDYFVFPGGAMKAEPAPNQPGCWLLSFEWDEQKYGKAANPFAQKYVQRTIEQGIKVYSASRVNEFWEILNGRGEVKDDYC